MTTKSPDNPPAFSVEEAKDRLRHFLEELGHSAAEASDICIRADAALAATAIHDLIDVMLKARGQS